MNYHYGNWVISIGQNRSGEMIYDQKLDKHEKEEYYLLWARRLQVRKNYKCLLKRRKGVRWQFYKDLKPIRWQIQTPEVNHFLESPGILAWEIYIIFKYALPIKMQGPNFTGRTNLLIWTRSSSSNFHYYFFRLIYRGCFFRFWLLLRLFHWIWMPCSI